MAKPTTLKLILLGDQNSGKTTLRSRFISKNSTDMNAILNMNASFYSKNIWLKDREVEVRVWDTGCMERYRVIPLYYREADCAVVVYDQNDRKSFERLEYWSQELALYRGNVWGKSGNWTGAGFVVVGNKADLGEEVGWSEAQTWARSKAVSLFCCSARTGKGVEAAFVEAARLGLCRKEGLLSSPI